MKVTAQDLLALGVIDRIVPEPVGGAHRDPAATCTALAAAMARNWITWPARTPMPCAPCAPNGSCASAPDCFLFARKSRRTAGPAAFSCSRMEPFGRRTKKGGKRPPPFSALPVRCLAAARS
jgi:enoyl-CoA hydratase/carnithine racemase